jgi:hypothetical protein
MMTPAFIPMAVVVLTTIFLIVSQNWRWSMIALALQYMAVFWLTATVWPLGLAVVKLIAGWMACAVLSASRPEEDLIEEPTPTLPRALFRVIAAGLVLALIVSITPLASDRLPINPTLLQAGMVLIGIGLLHLGMTTGLMRVIIGLLTVLSGFELVYAGLETSVMMAGLQVLIILGLAMTGAYLLAAPTMEENR